MTNVEQDLRSELRDAVADYQLDLDPDRVLSAGRRASRERSVHRLVLAGMLVVALSMAGLVAAPRIVAAILNKQTVELSTTFRWDGARSEFDQVAARLVNQDGVNQLIVTGFRKQVQVASLTRELPRAGVSRFRLGARTVVAVFPGKVGSASIVTDAFTGTELNWASGFDLTVGVGVFFKQVSDPERLDWLWVDAGGTLRHADGAVVPSARMTLNGAERLIYRNDRTDELGLWQNWAFPLKGYVDTRLLDGGMSWASGQDEESLQFGLLPVGARDVQLRLSRPEGAWGWTTLSDGSVVVLAIVPGSPDQVVTWFSYLRADGTRVAHGR